MTMAEDAQLGEVVLFGGYGGPFTSPLADTWVWNGTTWAERQLATTPPADMGNPIVFDTRRHEFLAFSAVTASTWRHYFAFTGIPDEVCFDDGDYDGDGVSGCDDPDCDGHCDPFCPALTSCAPDREHCGDDICTVPRENWANCPADCESFACGDDVCGSEENIATCADDCYVCGDLVCSALHENPANCAADCP